MRFLRLSFLCLATLAACTPDDPDFADAAVDAVPDVPVDLTAPETTLTATPAVLTNVAATSFEFTSNQPDATFRCSLDGSPAALCASPYTMVATEGEHTFTVFAVSAAEIADETPAEHAWRVDLTPPETTITMGPAALDNSVATEIAFEASEPATFACARDGGAEAPCTSAFMVDGLADGDHVVTVRATDEAGNVEPDPATHAWTVDTTAPDTVIDSGPTGFVASAAAQLTFSSPNAGAGAVFECALDGGAFATCASPRNLSGLSQGMHTFQVRVRDAVGNLDPTPAQRQWTVDTIAPTATVTAGPSGPTSDSTPTFSFTTAGAPTVTECRVGTGAFAPCSATFTPAALADGAHTFEVRVRDAAGNTGNATRAFTVDTVAPTVTITGGPSGPTGDSTPTFTFTTGGSPASITCAVGGQSGACTTSFTPSALPDGSYTFTVTATDAAGNTGMASRAFAVDTGAPTVTITGGPTGPTSDATPTFTFTTSGSPATTTCAVGGQSGACTTSFTPTALGDGSYTFTVTVADAAGNMGQATRTFTVDTVAPTATITSGPNGPTNDTTPTFGFTTAGSPATITCSVGAQSGACTTTYTPTALGNGSFTFTVTVTDAAGNTGTATRAFSVDTVAPTATITSGPTGPTSDNTPTFGFTTAGSPTTIVCSVGAQSGGCSTSFTPTALGDGSYTFTVTVTDAAGNIGTATRAFSVDTMAPTVSISTGPSGPTNDSTPTFTFTVGGSPTTRTCSVGSQSGACTTSYTPATALTDGGYTFTVTVTDAAGNTGTATRSFSVDTVAPTANITSGPTGPTNDNTPTFGFTTAGSPTTITCSVGTQSGACTTTYTPPTALTDGSYTFTVTVTDAAGNTGTATRAFSVDRVAPTVSITGGPTGPTNDRTPTFTFTTGGSPTQTTCTVGTQSASCSGSFTAATLSDGSYTFRVTVTDAAGNSAFATRSFSVDTVGPTVSITGGPTQTVYSTTTTFRATASGHTVVECRNYPQGQPGGSYFPCTIPSFTYAVQFPVYPPNTIANWTFQMRVRDAAGNTASSYWNYSTGIII
ncbi:MAG: Ig-like domain repeat protein [Deltaproteobacteria bacterium]|nr:Ig-like domain repeat protein [Kofleriaceae bacterium]